MKRGAPKGAPLFCVPRGVYLNPNPKFQYNFSDYNPKIHYDFLDYDEMIFHCFKGRFCVYKVCLFGFKSLILYYSNQGLKIYNMDKKQKDRLMNLVSETWKTLRTHKEWESRYANFSIDVNESDLVKRVEEKLKKVASKPKLSLYTSVSREASEVSLRFAGQIVAGIKEQKITAQDNVRNYFKGVPILPKNELLGAPKVDKFLSFFEMDADATKVRNKKRIIDTLLKEFRKNGGKDKILRYIQPVLLRGMFFSMPVPFNKAGRYLKGNRQGYIDILARVEKGFESRLCVMQVNNDSMEQALINATFIAALIRSKTCGEQWWDFLEHHEASNTAKSKKHLDIDVVTVMPNGNPKRMNAFTGDVLSKKKDLNCTFHCHTLYYDEKELLAGRVSFDKASTFLTYMKQQTNTNN